MEEKQWEIMESGKIRKAGIRENGKISGNRER